MRVLALVLLVLAACRHEPVMTEDQVLGGETIAAQRLEHGRLVYRRYCQSCHGAKGDGRGVNAYGQWPPPRDFREAKFKFAGVQDRGLPSDDALKRIITNGLAGTYMRPWQLREDELDAVVQYLKTFSTEGKGFRSESLEVKPAVIPNNPYLGPSQIAGAIREGERLYHDMFQCSSCHPTYVGVDKLDAWEASARPQSPELPVPKWSANYRSVLLPPDFLRHDLRAVRLIKKHGRIEHNLDDLYRSIAYGLMGPMPGYVHLGENNIWKVALYVKSLADQRYSEPRASKTP